MLRAISEWLFQHGSNHGQRRDRGGFGAKDAGAEAHRLPTGVVEQSLFLGGPSSFGADGETNLRKIISSTLERFFKRGAQSCGSLLLGQNEFDGITFAGGGDLEWKRFFDDRNIG